jgi:hypothetical protein
VHKAFAALPAEGPQRLAQDLLELIAATMVVPSEYLEVVITKK